MQRRGIAALHIDVVIVDQLVDLVGSYAGFDEIADIVQRFGGQPAQLARFCDFGGGFDNHGHKMSFKCGCCGVSGCLKDGNQAA